MPMDASLFVSTINAVVWVSLLINLPHTHVCVAYDKFTIVISLFYDIL
jgi:hypothetical protein